MTSNVHEIFASIRAKAEHFNQSWQQFSTEISGHLSAAYEPELKELTDKLDAALETLRYELDNPVLTLATTGTTSSGKSTLVNLLCGAEIMPVAVSEMSAGAVTVEYNDRKSLTIHETPGALWECGEWERITDDQIYHRLHDVMLQYIEAREHHADLACPQTTIGYPSRIFKESLLDLPQGTKVKILDLPGLAHVGDEGNMAVIKQCREALCLVTYNSAETDSKKVKNLLQEVVEQVKDLGGSPARMLFVLNRIDVFRADRSWPESEERFTNKTTEAIRAELTDQLGEYTQEIQDLQIIKLSTWPALLALQIRNPDPIASTEACKKADNHFNSLIDDIIEDLPRKVEKWKQHDRNRVADALWERSYALTFQQHLAEHVNQHFPNLVIPQILERFSVAAGNAVVEWSVQTTSAILNSTKERYLKERQELQETKIQLHKFLENSSFELSEPFKDIKKDINQKFEEESNAKDAESFLDEFITFFQIRMSNLRELCENEDPFFQSLESSEVAVPFWDWTRKIPKKLERCLELIAESLEKGKIDLDKNRIGSCWGWPNEGVIN